MNINCTFISESRIVCNGTTYEEPEKRLTYKDEFFWVYLGIYTALVIAAGLMSGLTMGLLSLDLTTLRVLKDGGTPNERKYAAKIIPIVKRHHLLLVTLLLGNAAAVEAMPIFLDRISDPVTAICVSVTAVLIFGEVVPQALCTRFGLAIGSVLSPLVYILMVLLFIIAWPLSKLLDCLLGHDHGTFYRRAQLKVLVGLHGSNDTDGAIAPTGESLSTDEVLIIQGALDMRNKTVKNAMIPIQNVYMLSIEDKLDHSTMTQMLEKSHSRIPVFEHNKTNIVGLLLMKVLIKLDPDDAVPVKSLLEGDAARNVLYVTEAMPLFDVLNIFQTGKSHLAVVREETKRRGIECSIDSDDVPLLDHEHVTEEELERIVGIITLEDVIEELIQEEILDETDQCKDITKRIQVARAKFADKSGKSFRRSQSLPEYQKTEPKPMLTATSALPEQTDESAAEIVDLLN